MDQTGLPFDDALVFEQFANPVAPHSRARRETFSLPSSNLSDRLGQQTKYFHDVVVAVFVNPSAAAAKRPLPRFVAHRLKPHLRPNCSVMVASTVLSLLDVDNNIAAKVATFMAILEVFPLDYRVRWALTSAGSSPQAPLSVIVAAAVAIQLIVWGDTRLVVSQNVLSEWARAARPTCTAVDFWNTWVEWKRAFASRLFALHRTDPLTQQLKLASTMSVQAYVADCIAAWTGGGAAHDHPLRRSVTALLSQAILESPGCTATGGPERFFDDEAKRNRFWQSVQHQAVAFSQRLEMHMRGASSPDTQIFDDTNSTAQLEDYDRRHSDDLLTHLAHASRWEGIAVVCLVHAIRQAVCETNGLVEHLSQQCMSCTVLLAALRETVGCAVFVGSFMSPLVYELHRRCVELLWCANDDPPCLAATRSKKRPRPIVDTSLHTSIQDDCTALLLKHSRSAPRSNVLMSRCRVCGAAVSATRLAGHERRHSKAIRQQAIAANAEPPAHRQTVCYTATLCHGRWSEYPLECIAPLSGTIRLSEQQLAVFSACSAKEGRRGDSVGHFAAAPNVLLCEEKWPSCDVEQVVLLGEDSSDAAACIAEYVVSDEATIGMLAEVLDL